MPVASVSASATVSASYLYSCTDQVIQFVRVYTPYTLKSPPYSHHERRRRPRPGIGSRYSSAWARARAGAHGANKVDLLVYTACTRVQTVSLDPYSCTGEMTPSIQVYTPDESTRTAVQPASLQTYSCAAGAMCAAHLCTATHSRCAAVLTISPVLG